VGVRAKRTKPDRDGTILKIPEGDPLEKEGNNKNKIGRGVGTYALVTQCGARELY